VNLVLSWADKEYKGVVTGKIYEYMKARKPILTIINGDRDEEIETIMSTINAGPVIYADNYEEASLDNFILSEYQSYIAGIETHKINLDSLKEFYWDYFFPIFLRKLQISKSEKQYHQALS
jgi:hypothetical protein